MTHLTHHNASMCKHNLKKDTDDYAASMNESSHLLKFGYDELGT